MVGEDEADHGRRSIPSLAHALEEARLRAARLGPPEMRPELGDDPDPVAPAPKRYGSLLDLAGPADRTVSGSADKSERTRLALEANAARRALSGRQEPATGNIQESMDEMRATLDECLAAVRECRELVRALAARRDRNYF